MMIFATMYSRTKIHKSFNEILFSKDVFLINTLMLILIWLWERYKKAQFVNVLKDVDDFKMFTIRTKYYGGGKGSKVFDFNIIS